MTIRAGRAWKLLDGINRALIVAAELVVVALTVLVSATVVLRYGFGRGTGWSTEVSSYMLFAITLLAAPAILRADAHIKLDLLSHVVSTRTRERLWRITSVIGLVLCATIFAYSINYTATLFERGDQVTRVLSFPKWIFMAPIAVSFLLLALVFIRQFREGEPSDSDGPGRTTENVPTPE
jgi:C4-dicarboxylate transporter DctQ subunit